jgi:xylan 1,4-beta-xylosidase
VNLEGALTWAFEFEDQPMFAGFRVLSTRGGVTLPVFNTFRMFGRMSGTDVSVSSTGEIPLTTILNSGGRGADSDVSARATIDADLTTRRDEARGPP